MTSNQYQKMYKSEALLTRHVKNWLNAQKDLFYWKASDRYTSGIADIIVCVNGRMVALELKDDTGVLSANQKLFGYKIQNLGNGIWKECRTVQDVIDAVELARSMP